ncbi:MAG: AMP-binding protein [Clostridia bacterium]|nr:AMP-binding protein [Clostridia bacterium]
MALELDIWTVEKLSDYFGGRPDLAGISLREAIDKYTAEKLAEVLEYAKANSSFYKEKIGDLEFTDIPFTTADELRDREKEFLCVEPGEAGLVLQTGGTTGKPKSIYFTEEDYRLDEEYFAQALRLVADETEKVLVLVSGSMGKNLAEALKKIGAQVIEYGQPGKKESEKILKLIRAEGVTTIVASATHMIALARQTEKEMEAGMEDVYLRSVLLVGEFVPENTVLMLEDVFQCMVFEHYGMVEMGQSCGIACGYSRGYHIREADLYIELINPLTGEVVPEESGKNTPGFSNYGEIVVTTLNRRGMPLIRYRTGDFSRWILTDCPCGSSLKMLDKVVPGDGRMDNR